MGRRGREGEVQADGRREEGKRGVKEGRSGRGEEGGGERRGGGRGERRRGGGRLGNGVSCTIKALVTLPASLFGTFLQTLPDLVTSLKGHSLSPHSALRKVWVLMLLWKLPSVQAPT